MAQLSDDCFAFGGPMMSVDEAVGLITTRVTPVVDAETVTLARADGRILAHDILAPLPLPPFTNSAVDGYAVSSRDLPQKEEQAFPVIGRVQAGSSASAPLQPGQAMRIFTGAPMPVGADTVFMQEDVRVDGDKVVLPAGLKPGANVRPAGEDIPAGFAALKAAQRLRPQDVALGIIGGTPFIGLPGNPVASFVTFVHVVRPTILALSGARPEPLMPLPVRAAFSYKKKIARREYVRVTLRKAADGALEAVKFPREGAGLLSSLADTDGLVELGEDVAQVAPGQTVGFLSYASLTN